MNHTPGNHLRQLPSVNALLEHAAVIELMDEHGRIVVTGWVRDELARYRKRLAAEAVPSERGEITAEIVEQIVRRSKTADDTRIGRVVNATGVILHTGLGRAPLSSQVVTALGEVAAAGNIEIDLQSGARRYRGHQLQSAWQTLTGCEDSLVVNNNAAATLITLQALCAGREVIISRGQLIEIGGSFRLPEIFELSGAKLREVGTTNRTKLLDYERAIGPETAAIMHVHPSNYRVVGFAATPEIDELTRLAHAHNLLSIDDIGSGSLVDVTRFGLPAEPTFPESIACGADVVLGSGDKLLGGPQAGIMLGTVRSIEQIRQHPLARAMRVGKLTLGALSATLDAYLRGAAEEEIPTISLLAASLDSLRERAAAICNEVGETDLSSPAVSNSRAARHHGLSVEVQEDSAPVGGGSLPGAELPTAVLSLTHAELSADEIAGKLRLGTIRLFGRIQQDRVLIDLRSVLPTDDSKVALAIRLLAGQSSGNDLVG